MKIQLKATIDYTDRGVHHHDVVEWSAQAVKLTHPGGDATYIIDAPPFPFVEKTVWSAFVSETKENPKWRLVKIDTVHCRTMGSGEKKVTVYLVVKKSR